MSLERRVVITGIGMVTPLGLDTKTSWKRLVAGESGIGPITAFDAERFDTQIAGEVTDFDATSFMTKKEARRADRFTQLAVAATREALASADFIVTDDNAERVACLIASGIGGIITLCEQQNLLMERGPDRISPFLVPMILVNMASGVVSMREGLKGVNVAPVSACASSGDAIGQGLQLILAGDADAVVAGGTEAPISPLAVAGFNSAGALSKNNSDPKGASRPFDATRDGFVMGEGATTLLLERADLAIARGAPIIAELAAWGAAADAHHITMPAPGGEGATRAMRMALKKAGLEPKDISYINAHGTSTQANDKFETEAVKTVFGSEAYKTPISSTKSMTGHLLGAAGAAEAAVCALAIRDSVVPPTINLETPDPECDLEYTANLARRGTLKAAMSNSLGFGGHNTSLVFKAWQA